MSGSRPEPAHRAPTTATADPLAGAARRPRPPAAGAARAVAGGCAAVASARCSRSTCSPSWSRWPATYVLAEPIGPPAVIAPAGVLAALVAVAIVMLARRLRGLRALRAPQRARSRRASFDEVGDLFHALLAGSLLLLVVGQGAQAAGRRGRCTRRWRRSFFLGVALVVLVPCCAARCAPGCCPSVMRPRRALIVGAGDRSAGSCAARSTRIPSTGWSSSASSTTTAGAADVVGAHQPS